MSRQTAVPVDPVEQRRQQWRRELPDVDTEGMAILGRLRWITLGVRPTIEAIFARYGLDAGEFDVLATLLRSGSPYRLRPTELYRSLMISSGGLTGRLDRLEAGGLIRRSGNAADKRSVTVELTAEGRDRARAAFEEDMVAEKRLIASLTESERQDLSRLLARLALSIGEPA